LAVTEDSDEFFPTLEPLERYRLSPIVGFQVLENLTLGVVLDFEYRVNRTFQIEQSTGELVPFGKSEVISYGLGTFLRQRKIVTEKFRLFYQIDALLSVRNFDGTFDFIGDDAYVDELDLSVGIGPGFEFDLAKHWFLSAQSNLFRIRYGVGRHSFLNSIGIDAGLNFSSLQFGLNYRF